LDAADGQYGGLPGRHFPRDDGLQPNDDHRGKDHRVDGGLRHRTVRAAAVDLDAHAVGGRQHSPGTGANLAGRCGQDVLGECNIDSGQQFRKTVIDHCAGAVGCLLSRLKECDQGAAPMIGAISEELGRPEQRGDVHVVSAGMHDRYLVAIGVGGLHRAGVIESGGLFDR
jgi:hypothetical protein